MSKLNALSSQRGIPIPRPNWFSKAMLIILGPERTDLLGRAASGETIGSLQSAPVRSTSP
ncbi:hypothetical protein KIN20_003772 [Parelaphostrongylus tenuis]|uniref:Uncharacterized protein n=1 Tax=Parelaphostrongylus tenuis TaxID=148309 RepID=A0AAD5LZN9_PARTN|nr:hypothetical protein KIN20_003772 [Parelaphostrongylus tenuis]